MTIPLPTINQRVQASGLWYALAGMVSALVQPDRTDNDHAIALVDRIREAERIILGRRLAGWDDLRKITEAVLTLLLREVGMGVFNVQTDDQVRIVHDIVNGRAVTATGAQWLAWKDEREKLLAAIKSLLAIQPQERGSIEVEIDLEAIVAKTEGGAHVDG